MANEAMSWRSKGARKLVGATVLVVALLAAAIWQLHPSGAAPDTSAATSGSTVYQRQTGGTGEPAQYRQPPTDARPMGGLAELLRDRPQAPATGSQAPATRARSELDNPIIGAWQTHAVSSTAGVPPHDGRGR